MQNIKRTIRKAEILQEECVACGCCVKVCPRNAITINKGLYAVVNLQTCFGCGKCAKECPASVITIKEKLI